MERVGWFYSGPCSRNQHACSFRQLRVAPGGELPILSKRQEETQAVLQEHGRYCGPDTGWCLPLKQGEQYTCLTSQRSRNTALTKVIFMAFSVLPATQIPLCHEKRCHETIILTMGLKAGEKKTQISVQPKMAMPPEASCQSVCNTFSCKVSCKWSASSLASWLWNLLSFHLPSKAAGTSFL